MKKSVIKDLTIYMIGFGIFIGIVFPFFSLAFGIDKGIALSPMFVIACIMAGAFVGGVNIVLTRLVLVNRLKTMTDKMDMIKKNVIDVAQGKEDTQCDLSVCQLTVDSNDEIGANAIAFNELVETLALNMSGEKLVTELDKEVVSQKALQQIIAETKSTAGSILIEKEGELILLDSYGLKYTEDLCNNKMVLRVVSDESFVSYKLPEDIIIDGIIANIQPREVIVKSLIFNNIQIGVILIATTNKYSESDIEKLGILTNNLSLALQNAIIHEQIQKLAAVDPLTNVFNRRFGTIRLKDEYARSVRMNVSLGLIMLDLDHFKKVNDNYGHLAGDKVLVTVSKLIKNALRDGDIVIRYGGEEFIVILPGASQVNTRAIGEKLRRIIEENIISFGDLSIHVTASIGAGSMPEDQYNSETRFLDAVDKALYVAKGKGRNQVCLVSDK